MLIDGTPQGPKYTAFDVCGSSNKTFAGFDIGYLDAVTMSAYLKVIAPPCLNALPQSHQNDPAPNLRPQAERGGHEAHDHDLHPLAWSRG